MNILPVILAAGSSTRMSHEKQFLQYNNKTFIENIYNKLSELFNSEIVIITGSAHEKITSIISDEKATFINNIEHKSGLANSISKAAAYAINKKEYDAILLTLTDQPLIQIEHFKKMLNVLEDNRYTIIASTFANSFGPPVIFKRTHLRDLINNSISSGGKNLILERKSECCFVECPSAEYDIDTDEDYQNLIKK